MLSSPPNYASDPGITINPANARDIALSLLADDFLEGSNFTIETRMYVIDHVLPTIVLALEGLLTEVQRNDLVDETGGLKINQKVDKKRELGIEKDKPESKFNSVNWLAQHLFRNNPRFKQLPTTHPYFSRLTDVRGKLTKRFEELKYEEARQKVAAENVAKAIEENANEAVFTEKKNSIQYHLTNIFQKWTEKYWRDFSGTLSKAELHSVFNELKLTDRVRADVNITKLMDQLLTLTDPATHTDTSEFNWNMDHFVESITKLLFTLSQSEIDTKLVPWVYEKLEETGAKLAKALKDVYFFPVFKCLDFKTDLNGWKDQLSAHTSEFRPSERYQAAPAVSMTSEIQDFCSRAITVKNAETEYLKTYKQLMGRYGIGLMKEFSQFLQDSITKAGDKKITRVMSPFEAVFKTSAEHERRPECTEIVFSRLADIPITPGILEDVMDMFSGNSTTTLPIIIQRRLAKLKEMYSKLAQNKNIIPVKDLEHTTGTVLSDLNDKQFIETVSILKIAVESASTSRPGTTSSMGADDLTLTLGPNGEINPRSVQELTAITGIFDSGKIYNTSIENIVRQSLSSIKQAFENIYDRPGFVARVCLLERGMLKPNTMDTNDISEPKLCGASESFLRVVGEIGTIHGTSSVSEMIRFESKRFEVEVVHKGRLIKGNDLAATMNALGAVWEPSAEKAFAYEGKFVGIPLLAKDGSAVGAFVLAARPLKGKEDESSLKLSEQDIKFLQRCMKALTSVCQNFTQRLRTLHLIQSLQTIFGNQHPNKFNVDFHFAEKSSTENKTVVYACRGLLNAGIEEIVASTTPKDVSPYFKESSIKLDELTNNDEFTTKLYETFTTQTTQTVTTTPPTTLYPLPSGILSIQPRDIATGATFPTEDLTELTTYLTQSLTELSTEGGLLSVSKRDAPHTLDIENLDETTRRVAGLLSFMYKDIQSRLTNKLDGSAVAELKSYRKPPVMIHEVLKCVLYVLGKAPKQVRTWIDAMKYVNTELLKSMANYDPTRILQKKTRFVKIKAILASIPKSSVVVKGGSETAKIFYEWLVVIVQLREMAMKQRKRRQDLFARLIETEFPDDGDDGSGGDVGKDDLGALDEEEEDV